VHVGERVGEVSALLDRPRDARALLVLAHGAGAGMRHAFLEEISGQLVAAGIATFRYQFPYVEEGRRAPNPPAVLAATVRAAVSAGAQAAPGLPLFAGGKSLGGRMTSTAAAQRALPGVQGLVFFGFPLHAPGKPARARAEHLRDVSVPMLFLQGTRDELTLLEELRPVLDELGDRARLHVVEAGDHSFHVLKRSGRSDAEVLSEMTAQVVQWCDSLV
jgi:predicted alpha/beta-hydrolase family hydrolase